MLRNRAKELVRRLCDSGETVAIAESCTAGLAADMIARIPGASRVFWGSIVSYTPAAKTIMLGVGEENLKQYGAVSREIACAMAMGAQKKSSADYAFSITGIAGPGSDGSGVARGTVWIATVKKGEDAKAELYRFRGSRNRVRRFAAKKALEEILKRLS